MKTVQHTLFCMQDKKYREFQASLIPTVDKDDIIGVRVPALRKFAKQMFSGKDKDAILEELPHKYYEENNLHGYMLELIYDFDECIFRTEEFLHYIDNWATCDTVRPKVFAKNTDRLMPYIEKWLDSGKIYTVRYAVGQLMSNYLDLGFDISHPERLCSLDLSEYYISMMVAWYFATALAKRYDDILPYLEKGRLDTLTHNRTIQKAIDSRRITDGQKEYLRTLRRK